jgi:DNA polymerase-3 subunit delta
VLKLFHGKNQYLSLREAKRYYKQLLESDPSVESIEIDAETVDATEIIELYETQGMFSSRKMLFVKRLNSCKNYADLVEHMKSIDVCGITAELIFWENKKIASNTKYFKLLKEVGDIYESPDLNKRSFGKWAKEETATQAVEIEKDAMAELIQRSNYDPERFSNELSKFKLLKKTVDLQTVKALTTDTFESDIWKLIDAINLGEKAKSVEILENLMRNNVEPHYILAMMYRNLRQVAQIKAMKEKGSDNREIASKLKIPPFTIPSLAKSSSRYSQQTIKKLYEKLTNLDYQIKVGEIAPEMGLTLISTIL